MPGLISRDNLVEGYSKLSASNSLIELSGPALAATLIELLTAPIALVIDAASFLLSSVLLGSIKMDEPAPKPVAERPSFWQQVRQGLSFIRHHAQLRPMLLNNSSMQLFWRHDRCLADDSVPAPFGTARYVCRRHFCRGQPGGTGRRCLGPTRRQAVWPGKDGDSWLPC
ncbi:MAG: hypothetical protein H6656_03610 [Ardenticatenaceae bacterium]|nr:hypothetical protein [Ardenticatenaceae bacterium]